MATSALTHDAGLCIICWDHDPPPIQSGCACRSDTGLAHATCLIEKAVSQQPHRGYEVWSKCQTCKQSFLGSMQTALGEAWWSRVVDQAEESDERLAAARNLAQCRQSQGKHAEAERIFREVLGVHRRVLGEEHLMSLDTAACVALSLWYQAKHADAERINREVLGVYRRVLGEEHPRTLNSAHNLAGSLSGQAKHAEAARIQRKVLAVYKRVLGEEHPDTLRGANNLAFSLSDQGEHAQAERIHREVLGVQRRVLGEEHPDTLQSANNLASTLSDLEQ